MSRTFYYDSLHAQRFQTLITSLFESIWCCGHTAEIMENIKD